MDLTSSAETLSRTLETSASAALHHCLMGLDVASRPRVSLFAFVMVGDEQVTDGRFRGGRTRLRLATPREGPSQRVQARGSCCRTMRSRLSTCRCGVEPLQDEKWPHGELGLGFDTQAWLLETVVLVFRGGEAMVLHAMPARRQFWDLLP